MQLILAYFSHSLADEEKKLVPDKMLRKFRINRDMQLVATAIFLLSTAPVFYTTMAFTVPEAGSRGMPVRGVMWVLTLALSLIKGPLMTLTSRISRPSPPQD